MHIRRALRKLIQFPLFTAVAVLTLAIGVGANVAMFAIVYGVLLRPLAYPAADRLVAIDHAAPGVNIPSAGSAPFLFFTYRDQAKTLQQVALWQAGTVTVTGLAEPEQIPIVTVSQAALPILGVTPAAGRLFTADDDSPGAAPTVILSYDYWQARFGGDRSAIGRLVKLDGRPSQIVGVLPASFHFLDRPTSAFVPLQLDRSKTFLGQFSYRSIAQLAPGVTVDRANTEAARLVPVAINAFPSFPGFSTKMFNDARITPTIRPLKDDLVGDAGRMLWIVMGTIGLVLLVACANVANLLLVRTDARRQELAIRAALGAGRGRIARELMTESLLLGVLGGVAGVAIAYAGLHTLLATAPAKLPRVAEITIDAPVLLFSFAISVLAGAFFGAVLVLKYAAPRVATALRAGGRSMSDGRERQRARNALVVAQIAMAMILLVCSGLMIRTFLALRHVNPGFTGPQDVMTVRITIPPATAKTGAETLRIERNIADAIAAIPGVTSVGMTNALPMDGQGRTDLVFAEDKPYTEGQLPPLRRYVFVSPGTLATFGTPLVAGRDFTWDDLLQTHPVALVSETFARELWGSPSAAIGKRVHESTKTPWREIVGVVGDVRMDGVDAPAPNSVYWPLLMANFSGEADSIRRAPAFVIRSGRAQTAGFITDVSRAVWSVNPNLPLASVRTLQEIYDKSLARTSFALVMLSIAGGMALLLGVAGLYGVIAYAVSLRRREIGIRVALGAQPGEVARLFINLGLRLASIGAAIGVTVTVLAVRLMSSLLFGVSGIDPVTYAGVAIGLIGAALLACYVPAARAAALNPVDALRAD
jgi:predicted permease